MTIEKMLVASTANISRETSEELDMKTDDVPVTYDKEGYGWWVYVGPRDVWPHTPPADLFNLMCEAHAQGCQWLMLDRDADPLEGFPEFDW